MAGNNIDALIGTRAAQKIPIKDLLRLGPNETRNNERYKYRQRR